MQKFNDFYKVYQNVHLKGMKKTRCLEGALYSSVV